MFSIPKNVNVEELRRLAESDVPVLAFAFKRRAAEDWAPEHSHARGQFFALTRGLLAVEAGCERWMFPPDCLHKARSVGGVAGSMVYLSAEMCRGLPKKPCLFGSSGLLFSIVDRVLAWNPRQPLDPARKRLIRVLRDEIAQPEQQTLRLPLPRDERLARVARALLDDVADDGGLDDWAHFACMSRRTFMRAFSAEAGMSFGRWRQQARLCPGRICNGGGCCSWLRQRERLY
jgi:hypothetical protein